jgi:hypothetical protein
MEKEYIECGCCGAYHRTDFFGDCRNDAERFNLEDIPNDAVIHSIEEQMEEEEEEEYKAFKRCAD